MSDSNTSTVDSESASRSLAATIKKSSSVDKAGTSLDMDSLIEKSDIESVGFNEVDYAAMLSNTHIRMAVKELCKSIKFNNNMISSLRDIVLNDESGSSQRIISQLFIKFPGANFDSVKNKLDHYLGLKSRDDVNHYLNLLNDKIKKSVFDSSLSQFFDDKNLDKLIGNIDKLTENIHSSVIPFMSLNTLKASQVKDSFDDKNKLISSVNKLNICSNYKSLLKGQLIIVAAPPGVGKTQYLMNETYKHAKDGYTVIYLAMGDALISDFTIKLGCIHFNIGIDQFIEDIDKYLSDAEFSSILSRIKLSVVAAGEVNSADVRRYYKADPVLSKADVYIFDYDSNFEELSKMDMYSAHDRIYNNVYSLARLDEPKLVYIASQVKTNYYTKEFIPLPALAESNRKQAIADYVVTISGIKNETKNCGIFNIVKVRRGRLGFTPYMLAKSGKIIEIDMQMYRTLKSEIIATRQTSETE